MGRVSTNKGGKSGFKTSTGGGKGAQGSVTDSPVNWPMRGTKHVAIYNRATKMPVIKTTVVGNG